MNESINQVIDFFFLSAASLARFSFVRLVVPTGGTYLMWATIQYYMATTTTMG
jgi:hypothetical protein